MITKGTRVTTPQGPGYVAYVRMAPPNYNTLEAASVILDNRFNDMLAGKYTGTIFPGEQVTNGPER